MLLATLTLLAVPAALPPVQDAKGQKTEPAKQAAPEKKAPLPSAKDSDSPALKKIAEFIAGEDVDKSVKSWKTGLSMPPEVEFKDDLDYFWNLRTNHGDIKLRLMPDVAPMHVANCIYLTRLGFYDDIVFHRVISEFMAQGGCPRGDGRGNPGYRFDGEFDAKVKHDRPGMLSTANAGPGTDGSQFFITFVPTPHLDGKHTIYGAVVDGMGTVKNLEERGSPSGTTREPLKIEQATISVAPKKKAADGQ